MSSARRMGRWAWTRIRQHSDRRGPLTRRAVRTEFPHRPAEIKVLLVVRPDCLELVSRPLQTDPGLTVVAATQHRHDVPNLVGRTKPDIAVIDADLDGELSGVLVARRIQRFLPSTGIVLIAGDLELSMARPLALEFGHSWTYIHRRRLTDSENLLHAVNSMARGMPWLDKKLEDLIFAVFQIAARQRDIEDGLRSKDGQQIVPEAGNISVRGYQGLRPRSLGDERNERYDF